MKLLMILVVAMFMTNLANAAAIDPKYMQGIIAGSISSGDTTHAAQNGAVYSALSAKEDASAVAGHAKAAAVVNSTAGSETDQAASVSAMKSYVTGLIPATESYLKAQVTLVADDITAQYVDLAQQCKTGSLHLALEGLGYLIEDKDFTISVVSSKTRITFAGDLATAGAVPLIAGDKLDAKCEY